MRQELLLETATLMSGRSDIRLLRNEEGTRASEDIKNSTSFCNCLVLGTLGVGQAVSPPFVGGKVSQLHRTTPEVYRDDPGF